MLSISNVTKKYGNIQSLNSVNFEIEKGTCCGLVGPNGAGKSTLMKIIANIIRDYQGTVVLDGQKTIGYAPQDICLEENLTAVTNLRFYGEIHGLDGTELKKRTQEILVAIGLTDKASTKVKQVSGGMKRRLNIGCALMSDPDIIILDEPTVGVDPQSRRHIFQLIQLLKSRGKTIIYASHYMEEIETLCDWVIFIDHGKIVDQGTVSDLLYKHSKPSINISGNIPENWLDNTEFIKKKENEWVIMGSNPLEEIIELANKCKEENVIPNQLALTQPRLEEVFFALTGTGLRDEK